MAFPDDQPEPTPVDSEEGSGTEQSRKPLDIFLAEIQQKIGDLRSHMRGQIQTVMPSLPAPESRFNGEAFVDTVGTVVKFRNGGSDFFYTPHATMMRGPSLERLAQPRRKFFDAVAEQIPGHSRVLNIGAGGDVTPIESFRNAGHEIISTDMAEDTMRMLRSRTGMPTFACDLTNIDTVLDPDSVDVIIGNSTLGYLDPAKMKHVIGNLCHIMKHGGVFSFDLTPHPHYFELLEDKKQQTIVNNSAADPYKLLDFIKQFGTRDGINAMAYFSHYRNVAVNLATLDLLKNEFESRGMTCATGTQQFVGEEGMKTPCLTLRVSKDMPGLLQPAEGETLYDDPLEQLHQESNEGKPYFLLGPVDRTSGEILAKELKIHRDRKSDPWLVAHYIAQHQHAASLPPSIKNSVIEGMNPHVYVEGLRPYIEGKEFVPPRPVPDHLAADQVFHKLVIHGEAPFGPDEADRRIDMAYATQERQAHDLAERERQKRLLDQQKEKRAKEKAKKKQGRRK